MIVITELVHGAHEGRPGEMGHLVLHDAEEGGAVLKKIIAIGIGMLFHTGQEPGDRFHESIIVHHGVPLPAVEPGSRISIVFRENDSIGIDGFNTGVELPPEPVIELGTVAQVRRHVETPAVNTVGRREPFFGDAEDFFPELGGILVIQLRKSGKAPPALIGRETAVSGIVEMEKGTVGTVGTLVGTGLEAGLPHIDALGIHPLVEGAAVVKDAVKDDAHTAGVELLAEGGEKNIGPLQILHGGYAADILRGGGIVFIRSVHDMILIIGDNAEMGIDMLVILTVIFMTGGGDKNRIQVENLDTEILEIIELVDDPLDIAAVEAAEVGIGSSIRCPPRRSSDPRCRTGR